MSVIFPLLCIDISLYTINTTAKNAPFCKAKDL